MANLVLDRGEELREIVDGRLTAFVAELEAADWPPDEIVRAMEHVLRTKWLATNEALEETRAAVSGSYVSDGNEG